MAAGYAVVVSVYGLLGGFPKVGAIRLERSDKALRRFDPFEYSALSQNLLFNRDKGDQGG
jgi:hypothetical protein